MSTNSQTYAFTTKYSGIARQLRNDVQVSCNGKTHQFVALWDTGADHTCISDDVVEQLSLEPTGEKSMLTPNGISDTFTYLVNIILPNSVTVRNVLVCGSDIGKQGLGVLIGMDIIGRGDFSVSNFGEKTVFSFRIPSIRTTDYVQELTIKNLTGTHGTGKRKHKHK